MISMDFMLKRYNADAGISSVCGQNVYFAYLTIDSTYPLTRVECTYDDVTCPIGIDAFQVQRIDGVYNYYTDGERSRNLLKDITLDYVPSPDIVQYIEIHAASATESTTENAYPPMLEPLLHYSSNGLGIGMRADRLSEVIPEAVGEMDDDPHVVTNYMLSVRYPTQFYHGIYDANGNPIGGGGAGVTYKMNQEFPTGGTWFDGRNIYRRFYPLEAHASATQTQIVADTSVFGNNVQIVTLSGCVYSTDGYLGNVYPLPYAHYTAAQEVALYVEDGIIKTYVYGSTRTWASGWVMVEYVRDEAAKKARYPITPATGASPEYTASSTNSDSYKAWKAFDGNDGTSWASYGFSATGEWIQYELPTPLREIDVHVYGRVSGNVGYPQAGSVMLSNDGTNWIEGGAYSDWTQTSAGGLLGVVQCDNSGYYKFVRLKCSAKGGNQNYIAIGHINVYGYTENQ